MASGALRLSPSPGQDHAWFSSIPQSLAQTWNMAAISPCSLNTERVGSGGVLGETWSHEMLWRKAGSGAPQLVFECYDDLWSR